MTPVVRAFAGQRLVPRPFDGVGAGELPGQRRVEVEHPTGEAVEEARGQDAHPPGQHHVVGVVASDGIGEPAVVVSARLVGCSTDVEGGHPGPTSSFERAGIGVIRDHHHDLGGEAAVGAGIEDRLQVGTRPGGQDGKPSHHDATLRVPAATPTDP